MGNLAVNKGVRFISGQPLEKSVKVELEAVTD